MVMSDNPCAIWDKTKSSKTSATDLRDCPFIVIFLAIIRPHAFHFKLLSGMRSNFFMKKKKPLKTKCFQGFGGDNRTRFNQCVARPLPSQRQSTGLSHLDGFESGTIPIQKGRHLPPLLYWCRWPDSNRYAIAGGGFWVHYVYHSITPALCLYSIVQIPGKCKKNFCQLLVWPEFPLFIFCWWWTT